MEHVRVTALSGADWQGEPTPQRDGSLFPISKATALSQDREPSIVSTREKKTEADTKKKGGNKTMESLGTNKKKEAFSFWVLSFPLQL